LAEANLDAAGRANLADGLLGIADEVQKTPASTEWRRRWREASLVTY
jgi:hypothetical protein